MTEDEHIAYIFTMSSIYSILYPKDSYKEILMSQSIVFEHMVPIAHHLSVCERYRLTGGVGV